MDNKFGLNYTTLYHLTHPQKRIRYVERIYPNTSLYNIGGPIRIKGVIDFTLLEESINLLIKRNEGLRLRFLEQNGDIFQYVSEYEKLKLDFFDFSVYEESEAEFEKWVEKEARKPFQLENEKLFYFALFKISENDNGYLAKFHHIISDGWSINIMTEQICDCYLKLLNGEEIFCDSGHSYIEYIEHEKEYLTSCRFLKNKSFWNEKFRALPETLLDKSSDFLEGKRKTYDLAPDKSLMIKEFVAVNKCSLNTFFVTLYLIYLHKITQQDDIVIGTPVSNRSGKKEKSIFGMFTSTMPFRFIIDDGSTVLETISKVNKGLMECYYNQKYPYDLLVQDLELKKKGYDNLFNVCVNYYNTTLNTELNGLRIENVEFYNGNQVYSLQLVIKDWSDSRSLTLDFDYKVNDYTDGQIDDIFTRLTILMTHIINNPYSKVRDIGLLFENEKRKLLYEFNDSKEDYPKNKTIYQLFEEQVEKTPDKAAISFGDKELTYKQLNEKANQLARYLVEKGVQKETIVGLLTIHSIETVIGILGILKAGGAYLPIDADYPKERISYILKDSGTGILLANLGLSNDIDFVGEVINLDSPDIYAGIASNLKVASMTEDIVYVIYTSGSTGKPKGTMIEHQGLVNYICWAKKMYIKDEDEVFPLYSSLAFDLTVTSIFTPLISGSKIIVYRDDEDEYVLFRILKENKATIVKLTPAHLSLFKNMNNRNSSIRRFIVGGEDLKVNLARCIHESFGGSIEIFNEYGPTETVVGCMLHKYDYCNDIRGAVPIGIPAHNVQVYILDRNLNPVPTNTVGEIYISGDGVAKGYLNKPELTKEKFISNPFIKGQRMYKSGDLARFLSGGKIEYLGRSDHQVKIRGYRIELGEIEKYLLEYEKIKDAVVVDFEDKEKCKYLCAFIIKKSDVSANELKDYLLKYLPGYMIPLYFIEIDEIPLTSNGKVNREMLPEPKPENGKASEFSGYRSDKEEELVNVICEVLNIEKATSKQNFYHIGGDSIKAIQVASKMNDGGFKLKAKDILSHPVIEEMALCIRENESRVAIRELCEGSIKPTPIVSWFFAQDFANHNHYNQSVLLELKQDIKAKTFQKIIKVLVDYHDSLKINYDRQTKELYYNNEHLTRPFNVEEYDLSSFPYQEQVIKMRLIGENLKASFDIENGIMIKACLFDLGQNGKRLLLTAHHLVIDGMSWRIILDDIYAMLIQEGNGQGIKLPAKTSSYKDWALKLSEYSKNEVLRESNKWTLYEDHGYRIPYDFDLGDDFMENCTTIYEEIAEDVTEQLFLSANSAYGTETNELLITSLALAVRDFTKEDEIIIELEGHGRGEIFDDIDISRTVGWFTCIYPVCLKLSGDEIGTGIKSVKEQLRMVNKNSIDFGVLKYISKIIKNDNKRQIKFNNLGDFSKQSNNELFAIANENSGLDCSKNNHMTCEIDIAAIMMDKKLKLSIMYSRRKFKDTTMVDLLNSIVFWLKEVIVHCESKERAEFTPSDFDTAKISQNELDNLFF